MWVGNFKGDPGNTYSRTAHYNVTVIDSSEDGQNFTILEFGKFNMELMKHAMEYRVRGHFYLKLEVDANNPSWVAGFWEKDLRPFNLSFHEFKDSATLIIKWQRIKCNRHGQLSCGFPNIPTPHDWSAKAFITSLYLQGQHVFTMSPGYQLTSIFFFCDKLSECFFEN